VAFADSGGLAVDRFLSNLLIRAALQRRMSPGKPRWRAIRMARSTATQLISREYV
jgi:hypothetical protein